MTSQPDTTPDTLDRDHLLAEWTAAVAAQTPVGDCRRIGCTGKLTARPVVETTVARFFDAECDTCGHEVTLPNGRRLPADDRSGTTAPPRLRERLAALTGADGERLRDWRERAAGPDR